MVYSPRNASHRLIPVTELWPKDSRRSLASPGISDLLSQNEGPQSVGSAYGTSDANYPTTLRPHIATIGAHAMSTLTGQTPLGINYVNSTSISFVQRATINSLPRPLGQPPLPPRSSVPPDVLQRTQTRSSGSPRPSKNCLLPLRTTSLATQRRTQRRNGGLIPSKLYNSSGHTADAISSNDSDEAGVEEAIYEQADLVYRENICSGVDTNLQRSYASTLNPQEHEQLELSQQSQQNHHLYSTLRHSVSSGGESASTPLTSLSSLSTYERAPYCYVFE